MNDPVCPIPQVESPCIGTCTLGPEQLCVGCFRSGKEIAAWLSYSDQQRREIMDDLPGRAQRLFDD
ncbi:DUF1289 domain-containing protein [Wenzhouxiangella sp. AB-CW3]|uniref:DUF1289 domain-containing protein n=1 Tax=Wenzhouxiangella sp. AB-CW3 TaxID=2771012 RepID=UPI00168AE5A0|nr:DUF1289 domain-containing protein [Wenzhouxiangella sp. AB-CW3]QOC23609.1 DUF1289 domain-containing protein [Wenzhouxiangella sp. AB-CW3]